MLHVTRVELKNIRCFEDFAIDFDGRSSCTLLVGDNGDGKSTVLRSLAMGLCDQSSAAALFRELPGDFIRRSAKDPSHIRVFLSSGNGWRYRIETKIYSLDKFERLDQTLWRAQGNQRFTEIDEEDFPWASLFVSAYGPGIRTFGNADYSYYQPVDAVYSLFRYDAALQSPELVIRRLVGEAGHRHTRVGRRTLRRLRAGLARLLNLKNAGAIELDRRGISVAGAWGREELGALGDGYRATATWTLDLVSWWLLYHDEPASDFVLSHVSGVVIIDEVEQHLHPRWQRTIVPQLRDAFPNVQFVIATHSPLVASSTPDVTVHQLKDGRQMAFRPYGWQAKDVYGAMGVPSTRAATFDSDIIDEFARLDRKAQRRRLSPADRARLVALRRRLKSLPATDPAAMAISLHNMVESLRRGD